MFQKVQYGPAGHRSWCRSSLSWGGSLEKHLAAFTPQQEGQEPGMGFGKVSLKGGHLPRNQRFLWGFGSGGCGVGRLA